MPGHLHFLFVFRFLNHNCVSYPNQLHSHNISFALIPIQRRDGFWNVSLHDPSNFGGKETSGTALFTYGFAWGINNGILNKKTYKPLVIKSWNAMVKDAVHPNGILGYVQGTVKEPKNGHLLLIQASLTLKILG